MTSSQSREILEYLRKHAHRVSDRTFAAYIDIEDVEAAVGYAQNCQRDSRPLRDDMVFAAMMIRVKLLVARFATE